ncbi:hypothetical protein ACU6QD_10720 [Corynebacterium glucuronolyticum]
MTSKVDYTPGENMAARQLLAVLESTEEQFAVCRRDFGRLWHAAQDVVDAFDGHAGGLSPRMVKALDELQNVVEWCL